MENYLHENFDVQRKNLSPEASSNWRKAVSRVVKNPARRFRHVPDPAKRAEAEKKKKQTQEKIRVALYPQKAALMFIEAGGGRHETVYRRGPGCRSKCPQVTIVGRRDVRKLKNRDGVEGIARIDGSDKMKFCTVYLMNRKLIMYILVVVFFLWCF
ncbi:probable calcium-transporting ATPase 9, plasma membrane-type [Rosa rugosa]|uniref:probable calcium-transporting ATPase 9, plasma membrane-type n=1 Tax=Rosa rugosa TaxID=74645 RepID=UPI002B402176|nr:probable calcium-transporting ATPase 9, plasma membrane-type [Rosa rugosa]